MRTVSNKPTAVFTERKESVTKEWSSKVGSKLEKSIQKTSEKPKIA